jgi:O-antigen/teichoic acid export membrane protein
MPIVFRLLGASRFGILSIALLSPALAASLDLGVTSAAVRRLALALEERGAILGAALGTYALALTLVGIALGLVVAALAPWLVEWLGFEPVIGAEPGIELLHLCALWMGLSLALSLPGLILRARLRFGELTIVQSACTLVLWVVAIALSASGSDLWPIVGAALLITVLSAAACVVLARRDLSSIAKARIDIHMLRSDARFSSGLFLVQLSNVIAFQLDRVIVSALASPAAAGVYALCVGVANKTLFAVAALTSFAYPRVAAMLGSDKEAEVGMFLQALSRVAIVVVAPVILPAVLLSGPFLNLWLGGPPAQSVQLMQLLWVGYALAAVCAPATHVITGTGTSRLAATFAWVTAILLLSGMYLLVPPFGLVGAGIANVIAMSSALVFLLLVRRQLDVPRDPGHGRLFAGIAAGCLAQLALLVLLLPLVNSWMVFALAGLGSLAVYQVVRWFLGSLAAEEVRLIQSLSIRLR